MSTLINTVFISLSLLVRPKGFFLQTPTQFLFDQRLSYLAKALSLRLRFTANMIDSLAFIFGSALFLLFINFDSVNYTGLLLFILFFLLLFIIQKNNF